MDISQYTISIPKEELAQLPAASFRGKIHVIDKIGDVEKAVSVLRKANIVGFDTETRPSFKRGQSFKVSLLQLSTEEECFLFRLNKIGMPQAVIDYLEDENRLKIGLSLHDDFCNLNKLCPICPQGFIDLQQYARNFLISDLSLTKMYGILFGQRISKTQRLTNWEASQLTDAQKCYASLDALACIDIYKMLRSGNFRPEHSKYFHKIEIPEPSETHEE